MNILITGANGFVGKNLTETLKNIRDGKDKTHPSLKIDKLFEAGRETSQEQLMEYCKSANFVYHLAGVNRPKNSMEFKEGNVSYTKTLLKYLSKAGNKCPLLLSSSIQASLEGRFEGSEYGESKLEAEKAVRTYGDETGADVIIYRFPNLFGKWCKPNFNSVVATFCNAFANDLPYVVNDSSTELALMYIDDVVNELISQLECLHKPRYLTYEITLDDIIKLLTQFKEQPQTLMMPELTPFSKKLYSTYLSYLPKDKVVFPLKMNTDFRGSFTEILKTNKCGQFSVNVSRPGISKGDHWHNSKWELFVVVSGHGLVQERKLDSDEVIEFEVNGNKMEAVHLLPGYTHRIVNLSNTEDLVTIMWANETFDANKPDTFSERVIR